MGKFAKIFTSFFLIFGLAGCGGGGGEQKNSQSGTQGSPATPPPIKVMNCADKTYIETNFDQEISETPCSHNNNVSIFLRKYADGSGIYVDTWIKATDVIYGQGFYLAFDPAVLQYDGYESGQFFGSDSYVMLEKMGSSEGAAGGTFYGCDQQPGKSVVVVGITRLGAYTAELSGNNLSFRLKFRIVGSGETNLVFAKTKLKKRTYKEADPLIDASSCWPQSLKIKI